MSELFREAFRANYAQQARRTLKEIGEYATSRNPEAIPRPTCPGLSKRSALKSPAGASYESTSDSSHRYKRLGFPSAICEASRNPDFGARKGHVSEDVIASCDEIDAEILRVLTEEFSWERRRVIAAMEAVMARAIRVSIHGAVKCAARRHAV